jgi:DNA-binding HxlR family transcriptional regulator
MVNHYYFYGVDRDFGPFFLKFCSYFPYNGKLYLNGHEYAKRQLSRKRIQYEALDNGVRSCSDVEKLQQICDAQRASALRFADSKVQALWNALLVFRLLPKGFSNAQLRMHLAELLGKTPSQITPGAMTYQLRRLRLHGLIQRIPKTHRYQVTDLGFRAGLFFSKVYSRILRPGIAFVLPDIAAIDSKLRCAFRSVNLEVENWIENAKLVAA